jgi:hypothetical protein
VARMLHHVDSEESNVGDIARLVERMETIGYFGWVGQPRVDSEKEIGADTAVFLREMAEAVWDNSRGFARDLRSDAAMIARRVGADHDEAAQHLVAAEAEDRLAGRARIVLDELAGGRR